MVNGNDLINIGITDKKIGFVLDVLMDAFLKDASLTKEDLIKLARKIKATEE